MFFSTHCPVCKGLAESVTPPNGGALFKKASKYYILLLMMHELEDEWWGPDGRYVPRAYFVANGTVRHEYTNEVSKFPNGKYKYTYHREEEIVDTMARFYNKLYAKPSKKKVVNIRGRKKVHVISKAAGHAGHHTTTFTTTQEVQVVQDDPNYMKITVPKITRQILGRAAWQRPCDNVTYLAQHVRSHRGDPRGGLYPGYPGYPQYGYPNYSANLNLLSAGYSAFPRNRVYSGYPGNPAYSGYQNYSSYPAVSALQAPIVNAYGA